MAPADYCAGANPLYSLKAKKKSIGASNMPSASSARQGQSSKDKIIAATAILVVVIAAILIYKVWASQQIQVGVTIQNAPGFSEKSQAMKAKGKPISGDEESPSDLINPSTAKKH